MKKNILIASLLMLLGCGGEPLIPPCNGPIDFEPCKGSVTGGDAQCWVGDGLYDHPITSECITLDVWVCIPKCESFN